MSDSQDSGVNVEDMRARRKDFRKVQVICFFGVLLPLFLVCTVGWLLSAIISCKGVPARLSASSFAEDIVAAPITPTIARDGGGATDLILSDLDFFIDNQVTALLTFCGHSCAPSSSNISNNLLYSINDTPIDSRLYKRGVLLGSSSMTFQCDYMVSNIDLSGYPSLGSPTSIFLTSGKSAAVNITLASVPMIVSLSLGSSVSSLQVWNHSKGINASLFGPVYMENVSGDVLVGNSTELLIINSSTSNMTAYTSGRASIYWTNSQPVPALRSLTLLVAYNATTTAGPYLLCMPIDALMQGDTTSVSMSLSNRGISGSVTLTYYEDGQPASYSEASLTTVNCKSFDIQHQQVSYSIAEKCQFGAINIVITKNAQPSNSDSTAKVVTVHNNGQVDLHLYRAGDALPDLCVVQSKNS